jgi:hypothetical protein
MAMSRSTPKMTSSSSSPPTRHNSCGAIVVAPSEGFAGFMTWMTPSLVISFPSQVPDSAGVAAARPTHAHAQPIRYFIEASSLIQQCAGRVFHRVYWNSGGVGDFNRSTAVGSTFSP